MVKPSINKTVSPTVGTRDKGQGPAAAGLAHEPKNIASELNDIFAYIESVQ